MDQKLKNFDRNIEQMMNENAVTPPFGMWNRISAELEAEVAAPAPASVNSPIPERTILGFIAGALLIGASLITAYLVDNSSTPVQQQASTNATIVTPAPVTPAFVTPAKVETPAVIAATNAAPVIARSSKPKSIAKPVEEKVVAQAEPATSPVQSMFPNSEVMVPTQEVAENGLSNEPYFFPAIDMGSRESKPVQKTVAAPVTKAKTEVKADDDEREDAPRIKFRPQKHKTFKYGRYNRLK